MSEEKMPDKSRNFKEIIEREKHKTSVFDKIMKLITRINTSTIYAASFLLAFVALDALIYWLLAPDVLIWAIILIVVAVVCSLFANSVTKTVKKQQWKYAGQ
jgi:membrane protein YdbS with pleckstrin-like domain